MAESVSAIQSLQERRPIDLGASSGKIHRFVARRVSNPDDAADIAQQTLLQACAKRSTWRGEHASAWLFSIARHLIVDHYRARSRFKFLEAATLANTEPALRTAPDAVHLACQERERLGCWVGCISRRLPLEQQLAVLLADGYGHRDKDSAKLLGTSLPSFKLLLHHARARLNQIAGGSCAVASRPHAADGRPANSAPVRIPLGTTPTTRRRTVSELLALRARLVEGLGL